MTPSDTSQSGSDPRGRIVLARVYETLGEASIALGALRTYGIPCILDNAIMASVFGIPAAPFDGIRLMVFEKDLPEALRLLDHPDQ